MNAPAAIRATFAQYAMVKTRGVLVLHMEVPLEQQAEVFAALGYPLPGGEVWCGIARLVPEAQRPPARRAENGTAAQEITPSRAAASEQGKARYAAASDMEKALVRAARLSDDRRFCEWVGAQLYVDESTADEIDAIQFIRDTCCAGKSRKLIAEDPACYDAFVRMETEYLIAAGILAEPR